VIGQFEVGVVNSLSAGAECANCLAFRVTCAAVGGPFEDFPGVLRLSSRGVWNVLAARTNFVLVLATLGERTKFSLLAEYVAALPQTG